MSASQHVERGLFPEILRAVKEWEIAHQVREAAHA